MLRTLTPAAPLHSRRPYDTGNYGHHTGLCVPKLYLERPQDLLHNRDSGNPIKNAVFHGLRFPQRAYHGFPMSPGSATSSLSSLSPTWAFEAAQTHTHTHTRARAHTHTHTHTHAENIQVGVKPAGNPSMSGCRQSSTNALSQPAMRRDCCRSVVKASSDRSIWRDIWLCQLRRLDWHGHHRQVPERKPRRRSAGLIDDAAALRMLTYHATTFPWFIANPDKHGPELEFSLPCRVQKK